MQQFILIAPPRSGASALRDLLAALPGWSTTGLSNLAGVASDREDFSAAIRRAAAQLLTPASATIDWDPGWSLHLRQLAAALPDARFIVVVRPAEPAIASLVEAWQSKRFATQQQPAGWWGEPWSYPLIAGWESLRGAPLARVCATQWAALANGVQDALQDLSPSRWMPVSYDELVLDPVAALTPVLWELGAPVDVLKPEMRLPRTASIVSEPMPGKWHQRAAEVLAARDAYEPAAQRLRQLVEARSPAFRWPSPETAPRVPEPVIIDSAQTLFKSEYSASMAELLRQAGMTLAISTYKSGHVILARHDAGTVNVEFHGMSRPMGIAVSPSRLAIGTTETIDTYSANTAVAPRVPSARPIDTAYTPRNVVFTGDVSIHDMEYDSDGILHFVNTRFSCLCTPSNEYSFVPTWRPPWISALGAEDRCHLNGLAVVDGRPRYVTALSRTDTAAGWREHKGTSGVIIDITDDRVVAEGLSMPHSPRWHDGRLWVLESGKGTLVAVDVATGEVSTVATLPGFTRGLAFVGQYALIGLSQVRESVFSALPVTEQKEERNCGVWLVDTKNGQIVGWLKFDGIVQEIFDVRMLPARWPTLLQRGDISRTSFVLSAETLRDVAPAADPL